MRDRYQPFRDSLLAASSVLIIASTLIANDANALEFVVDSHELTPDSPTGEWTIRHASANSPDERDEPLCKIVPPVKVEQGWYYAVCGDLLRLDPSNGTITKRVTFPSEISTLEADGRTLSVTVKTGLKNRPTLEFLYTPDESTPPNEHWSLLLAVEPMLQDVASMNPAALSLSALPDDGSAQPFDERARVQFIRDLSERKRQDPTNPFYDFFEGAHRQELGQDAKARELFESAAGKRQNSWWVHAYLATLFEVVKHPDLADQAWADAVSKRPPGIDASNHHASSVALALYFTQWAKSDVESALDRGDFAKIDRVFTRVHEMSPSVESGDWAWAALADWFVAQGQHELGQKWRANSEAAAGDLASWTTGPAEKTDLGIVFYLASLLVLPLAAMFAGFGASSSERVSWLPRPRSRDVVGLLFLLAVTAASSWVLSISDREVHLKKKLPLATMTGQWGTPELHDWGGRMGASDSKTELLSHHAAVARALTAGETPPVRDDALELLKGAIASDSRGSWHLNSFSWQVPVVPAPTPARVPIWIAVAILFVCIGRFVGKRYPRLAKRSQNVVPGFAPVLRPVGALLLALGLASVLVILRPADYSLEQELIRLNAEFFGLGSIWPESSSFASKTWAWVSLVGVIAAHAIAVVLARRGSSPEGEADVE